MAHFECGSRAMAAGAAIVAGCTLLLGFVNRLPSNGSLIGVTIVLRLVLGEITADAASRLAQSRLMHNVPACWFEAAMRPALMSMAKRTFRAPHLHAPRAVKSLCKH